MSFFLIQRGRKEKTSRYLRKDPAESRRRGADIVRLVKEHSQSVMLSATKHLGVINIFSFNLIFAHNKVAPSTAFLKPGGEKLKLISLPETSFLRSSESIKVISFVI